MLLGVTEARAKVGTIQATPELINDAAAYKKFQAAHGELSQGLKSLRDGRLGADPPKSLSVMDVAMARRTSGKQ